MMTPGKGWRAIPCRLFGHDWHYPADDELHPFYLKRIIGPWCRRCLQPHDADALTGPWTTTFQNPLVAGNMLVVTHIDAQGNPHTRTQDIQPEVLVPETQLRIERRRVYYTDTDGRRIWTGGIESVLQQAWHPVHNEYPDPARTEWRDIPIVDEPGLAP